MKLIFIGSGSAFTIGDDNYHSNVLLDDGQGQRLLIDCGSDARLALHDLGYSYSDIQNVYISHLHSDHVGGLEWLALKSKFDPNCNKPNLYASQYVMDMIWKDTLSGGLTTLTNESSNIKCFFQKHPVIQNGTFTWNKIQFTLVQTLHVVAGFYFMPSFGLLFTINGTRIFFTTDTQFTPLQLEGCYQNADIIFNDCETSKSISGVHAHYNDLKTLDKSIKEKMWLYHYNPGPKPDPQKDGFLGFVKRGQVFEF